MIYYCTTCGHVVKPGPMDALPPACLQCNVFMHPYSVSDALSAVWQEIQNGTIVKKDWVMVPRADWNKLDSAFKDNS